MLMTSQAATLLPPPGIMPASRFPRRHFAKGSFIRQPDDRTDQIYLIETGKVSAFFLGPQGHDVPLPELGAGDVVGDLPSMGGGEPATYFQAAEETVALVMSQGQFLETFRSQPDFAERVGRALYARLRALQRLYIEGRLLPMKTRLYAELIRCGVRDGHGRLCISPMPTHAELARRIASQRETVTKQMSQLAKLGVIEQCGNLTAITDEAYLRNEISKSLGFAGFQ